MVALSILYADADDPRRLEQCRPPAYFVDLNLDQAIALMAKKDPEPILVSTFHRPLRSAAEMRWRQAVFRDLRVPGVAEAFSAFSERMREVRRSLSALDRLYGKWFMRASFLESALLYRDAVMALAEALRSAETASAAIAGLRAYLLAYSTSEPFQTLSAEIDGLKEALARPRYAIIIKGLTVKVKAYEGEADYGADIVDFFARFGQGGGKSYLQSYPESAGRDSVQERILSCVAKLFPEAFSRLDRFFQDHASFVDETLDSLERESRFYLSWLAFIEPLERQGLSFCLPELSDSDKLVSAKGAFDVALARKLADESRPVVTNDFALRDPERIIVVTGPNQGGKTTFARTFGQLHHLAALGCPVPGERAALFAFDAMFSHFEREESLKTHRGKLHEELLAIHSSLSSAIARSIFILNEVFTSTTLKDSIFLSERIMRKIEDLDALCVCVTFLDELASLGEKYASFVTGIDPEDPAVRTFRLERRPADGLAYARSLAHKRRLTYDLLAERIRP